MFAPSKQSDVTVQSRQDETLTQVFLTHLVVIFKPKLRKIHRGVGR